MLGQQAVLELLCEDLQAPWQAGVSRLRGFLDGIPLTLHVHSKSVSLPMNIMQGFVMLQEYNRILKCSFFFF